MVTDVNGYLGVDVGTSSAKAVLYGTGGTLLAQAQRTYPLETPDPFTAEIDPNRVFQAVLEVAKEAVSMGGAVNIRFLSLSGAMHSLLLMDGKGELLTNCITWADTRSLRAAEKIRTEQPGLYQKTGTPVHAMSPLAKILWLREEQPEIFQQTALFVDLKSYLLHRLFGVWLIDESLASATGLFDPCASCWHNQTLEFLGIQEIQLPRVVPVTHQLQGMDRQYAEAMGIPSGLPVVIGASDGALSNLGLGALEKGTLALSVGTSGAVRAIVDEPVFDALGRTFCYKISPEQYLIGGPVNNGGLVLNWLIGALGEAKTTREQLLADAASAPPGSDGLLFHPYLTGERAPLWNASARGSYFGLSIHHTRAHLARSALEGVIFNLVEVIKTVESLTGPTELIRASGGFSRSPFWRQLIADMTGLPVEFPKNPESGCLGAVLVGRFAIGELQKLGDNDWPASDIYRHEPDTLNAALYRELLMVYLKTGQMLKEGYAEIESFQARHALNPRFPLAE